MFKAQPWQWMTNGFGQQKWQVTGDRRQTHLSTPTKKQCKQIEMRRRQTFNHQPWQPMAQDFGQHETDRRQATEDRHWAFQQHRNNTNKNIRRLQHVQGSTLTVNGKRFLSVWNDRWQVAEDKHIFPLQQKTMQANRNEAPAKRSVLNLGRIQ